MDNLIFREEDHTYWVGGERIPSVTEIIDFAEPGRKMWFTEDARARGSAVHMAVNYRIDDDLDESTVHPIVAPYLAAWDRFVRDSGFSPAPELCERRMFNPVHRYAGTPDLVGSLNGRAVLIDIKTGKVDDFAAIQTAAYAMMPRITPLFPSRIGLQLKRDNTYRLFRFGSKGDFAMFEAIFKKFKQQNGEKNDNVNA